MSYIQEEEKCSIGPLEILSSLHTALQIVIAFNWFCIYLFRYVIFVLITAHSTRKSVRKISLYVRWNYFINNIESRCCKNALHTVGLLLTNEYQGFDINWNISAQVTDKSLGLNYSLMNIKCKLLIIFYQKVDEINKYNSMYYTGYKSYIISAQDILNVCK